MPLTSPAHVTLYKNIKNKLDLLKKHGCQGAWLFVAKEILKIFSETAAKNYNNLAEMVSG